MVVVLVLELAQLRCCLHVGLVVHALFLHWAFNWISLLSCAIDKVYGIYLRSSCVLCVPCLI